VGGVIDDGVIVRWGRHGHIVLFMLCERAWCGCGGSKKCERGTTINFRCVVVNSKKSQMVIFYNIHYSFFSFLVA
jgi:hypothetical protein